MMAASSLTRIERLERAIARREMRPAEEARIPWAEQRRPEQVPPPGDWFTWLILAGRGFGKTRTGAEWAAENGRTYPGSRTALVAATFADGRDTMIEGESGLLSVLDARELRGGSVDRAWNRSLGELFMANGSRFKLYSSEKPRQLRGPQQHFYWGDEPAYWNDAGLGTAQDTTWSNLKIGTRLPPRRGWPASYRACGVMTTTPRPVALLRSRSETAPGLTQVATTVTTVGRTLDNIGNLSATYRAQVVEPLLGTRLGRQELDAELLDDVPGALWSYSLLDKTRVVEAPEMVRVVVAIDPAVTSGEQSDETGIVVAGRGVDGHAYVLADLSCRLSPSGWAQRAVNAYHEYGADRIVAEVNNGGDMVEATIRTVDRHVPYRRVVATRGKRMRAEPIAALYEQEAAHHVGTFPTLEDQMCTFVPDALDGSPDHLDAAVWALTELMLTQRQGRVY